MTHYYAVGGQIGQRFFTLDSKLSKYHLRSERHILCARWCEELGELHQPSHNPRQVSLAKYLESYPKLGL